MNDPHRLSIRVYYEDTDFSGVVYHASYLRFMERGRTEFLRAVGVAQRDLHGGPESYHFVVRRMAIDWLRPAVMDDDVVVETAIAALRGASLVMHQRVTRGDDLLVTAEVTVAGLRGGKPARLPEAIRAAVGSLRPSA